MHSIPSLPCFLGEKAGDFLRAEWITIPEQQNYPRSCIHKHMVMQPSLSPESIHGRVFACAS